MARERFYGRVACLLQAGIAVNLADSDKAVEYVKAIEHHFGRPIEELQYDDFEMLEKIDKET